MPTHPMQRESDHGKIGQLRAFAKDWGWLIVLAGTALGFSVKTPGDELKAVKHEQAALKASIDTLKDVTKEQARDMNSIVRLQCFNQNYSTRELQLVGIGCNGLRNGNRAPNPTPTGLP